MGWANHLIGQVGKLRARLSARSKGARRMLEAGGRRRVRPCRLAVPGLVYANELLK